MFKLNAQRLYGEYKIVWFEFDLCGLQHQRDRYEIHVDPEFKQQLDTLQGKLEVMDLLTGRVISCQEVTPITITQEDIDRVEAPDNKDGIKYLLNFK